MTVEAQEQAVAQRIGVARLIGRGLGIGCEVQSQRILLGRVVVEA